MLIAYYKDDKFSLPHDLKLDESSVRRFGAAYTFPFC